MRKLASVAGYLAWMILLVQCTSYEPGSEDHIRAVTDQISDERLKQADRTPGDWLSYGRNYREDRFSNLDQINTQTIDRLGLAWSYNLNNKRGIETTPLVVDGIMYVTGNYSKVYAIDTRIGGLIWEYDPMVNPMVGIKACCGTVNRGAAIYQGLVYVGALDGRLIALDAATGQPVWEVVTVDTTKNYTITGAPRVVDGKVIIGNGGAEYGVRGYVTAYDALTGEQQWRFYTVPGDPSQPFESKTMEDAAKTWTGEWWTAGGGGTVWDAMAYDPDLGLLYLGVGNGSPWPRLYRSPDGGDNLYLSSIVAVNPDNGELVWYYQTTPGDNWDYTATQHLILADLTIEGQERKVIMQAPKNGFFYVIDRTNGDFISAEPYVYTNWAKSIDPETGRPIETDWSGYQEGDVQIYPSPFGGHNWQPMAYNPNTQLVYIPVHENSAIYAHEPDWSFRDAPGVSNLAMSWGGNGPPDQVLRDTLAPDPKPTGRLIAWDPISQAEKWRVNHEDVWWNGGVLTTAGDLVFQGGGSGIFAAYDASNGQKVWEVDLGTGIMASPVSYEVDGKQYISIVVGWGGPTGKGNQYTEEVYPGTVYTFALDADAPYPDYPKSEPKALALFDFDADRAAIDQGAQLYIQHCAHCHGQVARDTGGAIPDLGRINEAIYRSFEDIVLKGVLTPVFMPNFSGVLTADEVQSIKSFVLYQAERKAEEM